MGIFQDWLWMFEPNHNSAFVRTMKQCPKFGTQIFEEGTHGKYNGMFHNQIGEQWWEC